MSTEQTAINDKAVRDAAERLTATGWVGDAHRFVESLLLNAVASGWRRIEKPPELSGRGSTEEGRERAKELFARVRNGEHLEDTACPRRPLLPATTRQKERP